MNRDELFKKVRTEQFSSNTSERYAQQLRTYQIESLDKLRASLDEQSQAIKEQGKAEQKLSKRILCLNIMLGILTAIGAAAGVIGLIAIVCTAK